MFLCASVAKAGSHFICPTKLSIPLLCWISLIPCYKENSAKFNSPIVAHNRFSFHLTLSRYLAFRNVKHFDCPVNARLGLHSNCKKPFQSAIAVVPAVTRIWFQVVSLFTKPCIAIILWKVIDWSFTWLRFSDNISPFSLSMLSLVVSCYLVCHFVKRSFRAVAVTFLIEWRTVIVVKKTFLDVFLFFAADVAGWNLSGCVLYAPASALFVYFDISI